MGHRRSERGHQDRKQSDEATELADEATAHEADVDLQSVEAIDYAMRARGNSCACDATAATYCGTGHNAVVAVNARSKPLERRK